MSDSPSSRRQFIDAELFALRSAPQMQSVASLERGEVLLSGYQDELSVDETIYLLRICASGSQAAGRWLEGLQIARRGIELAARNYKPAEKIPFLAITGNIHSFLHNFHLAIRAFREAINIAEQEQLADDQAKLLQGLGPLYSRLELHDLALSTFERAYALAEKRSLPSIQAAAMSNMARQYRQMGDLDQAETRMTLAMNLAQTLKNKDLLPYLLHTRGEISAARGDVKAALADSDAAITLLKKRKNIPVLLRVQIDSAKWMLAAGDLSSARDRLTDAVAVPKNPSLYDIQQELALARVRLEQSANNPSAAFAALSDYVVACDDGKRIEIESQRIATQFVEEVERNEARGRREAAAVNELTLRLIETQAEAQRIARQVARDPLTGVLNRSAFGVSAQRLASRGAQPVSLLMLDIDNFGSINNEFGHLAGDAVLGEIVERLRQSLRTHDLLGRFGGDEFLLLCPGVGPRIAATIAARVLEGVSSQPVRYEGRAIAVSVSMGVACAQSKALETLPYLIKRADAALRRAKLAGKNRAVTVRV